jgi:hypothetical protein
VPTIPVAVRVADACSNGTLSQPSIHTSRSEKLALMTLAVNRLLPAPAKNSAAVNRQRNISIHGVSTMGVHGEQSTFESRTAGERERRAI